MSDLKSLFGENFELKVLGGFIVVAVLAVFIAIKRLLATKSVVEQPERRKKVKSTTTTQAQKKKSAPTPVVLEPKHQQQQEQRKNQKVAVKETVIQKKKQEQQHSKKSQPATKGAQTQQSKAVTTEKKKKKTVTEVPPATTHIQSNVGVGGGEWQTVRSKKQLKKGGVPADPLIQAVAEVAANAANKKSNSPKKQSAENDWQAMNKPTKTKKRALRE